MAEPSLALITPPTADVVTLAEVKAQLRVTDSSQDTFIDAIRIASINQIDPAGGGWLGRALRPQTWELRLSSFMGVSVHHQGNRHCEHGARHVITLPFAPLVTLDSLKYDDMAGVEHTLVQDTDFRILGLGTLGKQGVAPLYGQWWPIARPTAESVRIRFTAGYATTPSDTLPTPIKQGVLLMAKSLYDLGARNAFISTDTVIGVSSKSFAVTDAAVQTMRNAAENLLSTYRVF